MSKSKKRCRSRAAMNSGLPKGAYRTPDGGYITESRSVVGTGKNARVWSVRVKHRADPDLKRLARALVDQAIEEVAAEDPEFRAALEHLAKLKAERPG